MMSKMTYDQQQQALRLLSELGTRAYLIGLTDTQRKKGLMGVAMDVKEVESLRRLADEAQTLQNELMQFNGDNAFFKLGDEANDEPKAMFI